MHALHDSGEVVTRYGWLTSSEFTDIVALSQMTPGPIGINSATYVGYSAIVHAGYSPVIGRIGQHHRHLCRVLPLVRVMLLISKYFLKFQKHPTVESVFKGLRPAVVGLLAASALLLMNTANFGSPDESMLQVVVSILLFAGTFIASYIYKVNPILLIILCGAVGGIVYSI